MILRAETDKVIFLLGESMKPTLSSNNILITRSLKSFGSLRRNDIVIAIHPNEPKSLICKRLVALSGDTVLMNLAENPESDRETIFIKPGRCWLEGDNFTNSTDSRNYGQIPVGLIKSKVLVRIWPPSELRFF